MNLNDRALIRTESSLLVEGAQIGRVSLEPALYGTLSYAAGFGVHTFNQEIVSQGIMRYTEGLFISSDRCRAIARTRRHINNDPNYVCFDANYDESGGSVCNGDSGSPLVVRGRTPQDNYIIGVLSAGIDPLISEGEQSKQRERERQTDREHQARTHERFSMVL